ncbi:ABC transporter permease [Rhodococcus sp. NPDC058514]|uniref:ABC transporter permease n=1 Tax=unclassified Rhodococcus (in: high G+C Gram-positive bacteria) TaxID=192944 RepID=UPI00365F9925
MIWVTWRQCRATIIAALSFITLLIAVAAVAGPMTRKSETPDTFGNICSRWNDPVGGCRPETALTITTLLAYMLPVLLGMLVGVTVFSRDLEQRTHVLGFSQSVSRPWWYFSRVLVVFVPISLAMSLLGLVLGWTRAPVPRHAVLWTSDSAPRLEFPLFETSGIVMGGYTFLALMVGSTLALLLRSTLASMVLVLFGVPILLVALTIAVRPNYAAPTIERQDLDGYARSSEYGRAGSLERDTGWVVDKGFVDAAGAAVEVDFRACRAALPRVDYTERPGEREPERQARIRLLYDENVRAVDDCLRAQGADHYQIRYHRDGRFWRFQATETALTLTLSALLLVPAMLGLRRLRP